MLIIIKNIIGSKQNYMKLNNDKYTLIKDYKNVLHMPQKTHQWRNYQYRCQTYPRHDRRTQVIHKPIWDAHIPWMCRIQYYEWHLKMSFLNIRILISRLGMTYVIWHKHNTLILKSCWNRIFHEDILLINDFSENTEVVNFGSEFQRDDTLLEKKFIDELILLTSERIFVVGPLLELFK